MRPRGLAEVTAARADGRWDAAYASQREATVPDDLAAALATNPPAAAAFGALNRTGRYSVIHQLLVAGSAEARARQLDRALAALANRTGQKT